MYELGGDERLTYAELAARISAAAGKSVEYKDLSPQAYADALIRAGVPAEYAELRADADAGLAIGALDVDTGDLQKLIGRPSTPVLEVLRAAQAPADR